MKSLVFAAVTSPSRGAKLTPLEINTESVCSSASSEEAPSVFLVSPSHSPPITQDPIVDCLVWAQKKGTDYTSLSLW